MLRTALTTFSSAIAGQAAGVALAANAAGADGGDWMKVLPAGKWSARDGRGPFTSGQIGELRQIVERSLAYLGETEMMVDYGHDNAGRAAGWVKELEAREDGIWARVEWTEAARTAIKAGEFRYISPFITDKKGQVDLLLNFALVNMPALDLAATAASTQTKETEVDFMAKLRAALGLDASVSEATILEAIAANAVALAAAPAAALKPIALAAGLAETASAEQIAAAFAARAGAPDAAAFAALKADAVAMAAELKGLKEAAATEKAEALVDGAIRDKVVGFSATSRAHYIARARAGAEGFAAVQAEIAMLPRLGASGASIVPPANGGGDGKIALSAEQRERVKVLGISTEEFVATLEAERNQGDAA